MPWSSPVRERGWKRSILVHILLNKEPSLVAGLARQQLAGTGILLDSGGILIKYRDSCPQEFLQKIPVKSDKKNGIPVTPPKTHSCEKFLRKMQEKKKSSGILSGTVFWTQKINSWKQEYAT
jgi:hypothetical protein